MFKRESLTAKVLLGDVESTAELLVPELPIYTK
jgi:hypothetical protein